eukprot:326138_1
MATVVESLSQLERKQFLVYGFMRSTECKILKRMPDPIKNFIAQTILSAMIIQSDEEKALAEQKRQQALAEHNIASETGIQVWRIVRFRFKRWPKERYGEFYGSDCYVLLHTMDNDEGKKKYDVFFWIGAECSQDEACTAAYKCSELDEYLGDEVVQYHEVQGNESKTFLNLFPKVSILKGFVDSNQPRLLHVTGSKKHKQVYQINID